MALPFFLMDNPNYLKRAKSRDVLQAYSPNTKRQTVFPDFSFISVVNMLNSDPVARGALNHFVDKFVEGGYVILNRDDFSYSQEKQMQLQKDFKFNTELVRKFALMRRLFNNVYVEIVRGDDGRVKSLNILDSLNVEPITLPNGDPVKYQSKTPNPNTGEYPTWEKEDIVWIKAGDRSMGYAPVDLRALWETLVIKDSIRSYVGWLWKTGQYRVLYNFKTKTSDQDIQDFLAYHRMNNEDYKAPSIVKGEIETKVLRDIKETENIVELLKYLDAQTLILLRVSPIDAGIPDASGRSNSDAQTNSLSTTVTSDKQLLADAINYELFPKMNLASYYIRFCPNDRFQEKMVFENLQVMQSLGLSKEVMTEYMTDKGLVWATKEIFSPEPEVTDNPRSLDTMPSRKGKAPGEANQKKAEVSTRADQLSKN